MFYNNLNYETKNESEIDFSYIINQWFKTLMWFKSFFEIIWKRYKLRNNFQALI